MYSEPSNKPSHVLMQLVLSQNAPGARLVGVALRAVAGSGIQLT